MQGLIPTTENIAVACWGVLNKSLEPARLQRIRLWETENHYVEYHGE
jgi:6-pyruvoyltetrahydropterin/6-carboxytetrahydropterin synthase